MTAVNFTISWWGALIFDAHLQWAAHFFSKQQNLVCKVKLITNILYSCNVTKQQNIFVHCLSKPRSQGLRKKALLMRLQLVTFTCCNTCTNQSPLYLWTDIVWSSYSLWRQHIIHLSRRTRISWSLIFNSCNRKQQLQINSLHYLEFMW